MDFTVLQAIYRNDSPDFFDESLKSLYLQELKPKKIVLVCDGEIPESLKVVIEKWKAILPLYIVGYNENKGLAHALNYGLNFIDTELTARMDSDDVCYPDRFKKQIDYFENHPECEILGTGIKEFYINKDCSKIERQRYYVDQIDYTSKCLFKGTPLGHPTLMIKTELLKKFKYREDTCMNEDIDLWFRFLLDKHIINNLQEPLLHFRITDSTFKRRRIEKARNEFQIYKSNLLKLFGFDFRLIFPLARFLSRLLPKRVVKKLYFSRARKRLLMN